MRNLWFGGSFNPIHLGHLICSRAVAEAGGFDHVVLVPNRQSPLKTGDTSLASAENRLEMCRLAIAGDDFFHAETLELNRPSPSYTIDTVRQLRARGHVEINWLIGADMVNSLPRWHDPASLLAETRFVLMARPGWSFNWSALPSPMQKLQYNVVQSPQLDISSTDIRNRLAGGRSIRYLTPQVVVDYIRQHKLYKS